MPEFWTYKGEIRSTEPKDILFVRKLKAKGIAFADIQMVLMELGWICLHCFDAPASCQCENDE